MISQLVLTILQKTALTNLKYLNSQFGPAKNKKTKEKKKSRFSNLTSKSRAESEEAESAAAAMLESS